MAILAECKIQWVELLILILDLVGLFLVSYYLFKIPEPIKFIMSSPFGIVTDYQPVADAINSITRNFGLIKTMRIGLVILVLSQLLKLGLWWVKFSNKGAA